MARYKVLISIEILQLDRPTPSQRQKILAFLEGLAHDPNRKGDYEERDEVGRPVQIKNCRGFCAHFWPDHAVKEVKINRIEKADRK
ncbi:MAG: hypothetical protein ABI042_06865 [Verrucomicrobiota bacterium]